VQEASILAMRHLPSSVAGDRLLPAPVQGGQQTNDLGEFRLYGLAPGEYFIAAMAGGFSAFGGPNVAPTRGDSGTTTVMTYYPGTTDQSAAGRIVIVPGAEVGNIVFTLQTVPTFRVAGIVVDEGGSPIAHAMVMLMGDPRSEMFGPGGSAESQDDGRFVIGGVPAGTYKVTASIMMTGGDMRHSSIGGAGGSSVAWSSGVSGGGHFIPFGAGGPSDPPAEVVVTDADLENVRVVTRRPHP
jgi:hypothetical protein